MMWKAHGLTNGDKYVCLLSLQSSENSCMLYGLGIKQYIGCEFVLSVIDHRAFILSKYSSYFLNSITITILSHFQFLTSIPPDL